MANEIYNVFEDLARMQAEGGDEGVASYPVPAGRLADMERRAAMYGEGTGDLPAEGAIAVSGSVPQAGAASGNQSPGSYGALAQMAMQQAKERDARRQSYLDELRKEEEKFGQPYKMSNLDQAAALAKISGALLAPTRTGSFFESLGAAGTAASGPLAEAAKAERERQDKMRQLQMARMKMAAEMETGVPFDQLVKLEQLRQQSQKTAETFKLEEIDGKAVLVGSQGTVKPVDRSAAGLGPEAEGQPDVPDHIRAQGKAAVQKFVERMGAKEADTLIAAQQAADRVSLMRPWLDKAREAYEELARLDGIGPFQGKKEGWSRKTAALFETKREELRQKYEQAASKLELFGSEALKGQGAITDFERRIIKEGLPRLDATNAKPGLETFKYLENDYNAALKGPERFRNRGKESGEKSSGAKLRQDASAIEAARAAINSGKSRDAVIQRLRENGIDPSGL